MLEEAAERLTSPLLEKSLGDTLPYQRRTTYPWEREKLWVNGTYDGWHWYIARARAEVFARLGRWPEAQTAARMAVLARPMVGREWLILSVCAGRAGRMDESREAARVASTIDPTLPEAPYLYGLHAWREGRRVEAADAFRFAHALDSTWSLPALARVRVSLPGSRPDTLPTTLLFAAREVGLLTSTARPKIEEFFQTDFMPVVAHRVFPTISAEARAAVRTSDMALPVLVDTRGRIVLHELPWYELSRMPTAAMTPMLATLPHWRFKPASRNGQPVAVWVNLPLQFQGSGSTP
jgi:tetratricopeptide (TPR) repeat protein